MRFVRINNITQDMVLARPIFSSDGRILLNNGVKLETNYVDRLRKLGIPGVYVTDDEGGDIQIPDVISQRTRLEATAAVKSTFDNVRIGKTFTIDAISQSVRAIVEEITRNPNVVVSLSDVRSFDGYTFAHCVNVCVLSVMLALKKQLSQEKVYELAIGAILHDIGKTMIPEQIITKPGPLTDEEMELMKKHTTYGWELLRQHPDIPLTSALVAYQHHERPQGLGYPCQLTERDIVEAAKIVGVTDAYDAMTSERVYQRAMLPNDALKLIKRLRGIQFDGHAVDVLCDSVAEFPVGCMVRLNSNELGLVVDVNQADRSRPVIRLLYDQSGKKLQHFMELDLAKEQHYSIIEVLA